MTDLVQLTPEQVLALPMEPNDGQADTIGEYLIVLLRALIGEGEDFSSKRPFGEGGWKFHLYEALVKAKAIEGEMNPVDGWVTRVDIPAANEILNNTIMHMLGAAPWTAPDPDFDEIHNNLLAAGGLSALLYTVRQTLPGLTMVAPVHVDGVATNQIDIGLSYLHSSYRITIERLPDETEDDR